jgi:hypothetical protein
LQQLKQTSRLCLRILESVKIDHPTAVFGLKFSHQTVEQFGALFLLARIKLFASERRGKQLLHEMFSVAKNVFFFLLRGYILQELAHILGHLVHFFFDY